MRQLGQFIPAAMLALTLAGLPTLMLAQADGEVITKQYNDGSVYEGTFKDGLQDGIGKATYPTGDIYEGGFAKGKRQGPGKLTYKTGEISEGIWENGVLTAPLAAPPPAEPAATPNP